MSNAKTYVFGQDSNCMNWIAPLLQQKGIDPSVLAMMNNGGFGNGNWIWVFFLILLFGRNGFGGYGDKGRLGMRNDEEEDWWEEEKKNKRYKERYGNRMRY